MAVSPDTADLLSLNAQCDCIHLDPRDLRQAVASAVPDSQSARLLTAALEARPNLLAHTAVFLGAAQWRLLREAVATLEHWLWQDEQLATIPGSQTATFGPRPAVGTGLMRAYDFHLTESGPRLIEINTNAGGGFVALALQEALAAGALTPADSGCPIAAPFPVGVARAALLDSFEAEWRAGPGRSGRALQDIAIVDVEPASEFLYPDMLLAASALREAGYRARLAPLSSLRVSSDGSLADQQGKIDLVYNRLTDFELGEHHSTPLRQALQGERTLVSPAPWHHRIYAHKLQLARLTELSDRKQAKLPFLARTLTLSADNASAVWEARKRFYFKPTDGYAGKAVYAGRKLTRATWATLQRRPYVVQDRIEAPRRMHGGPSTPLRFDVRVFAARGRAYLAMARLYRGQTTNFRTPGGGIAIIASPVVDNAD
ncbi:MAG: hypothetical protein AAGI15_04720 [Pseudomonadota bacterium]